MSLAIRAAIAYSLVAALMPSVVFAQADTRCAMVDGLGKCKLYRASLIELIANPDRFHGKQVSVAGYLNLEFEGNGLYVHKEDHLHALYSNGLWVDVPRDWLSSTKCKNQSYVLLKATFDARHTGHGGMWSGGLVSVEACTSWN